MSEPTTSFRASKLADWEIQAANRLKALFQDADMSQKTFGSTWGIGTAGMVSQYLNAKRPLGLQAAIKFAKGFKCTVADISPTLAASLPNSEQNQPISITTQAPPAISFDDAVRVIAQKLMEVDEATGRRAMGLLADLATDPNDFERLARATLAVIETGKRRAA